MTTLPSRTPDTCAHRRKRGDGATSDTHTCQLLLDITGVSDQSLCEVRLEQCELCCRQREPRKEAPNGLLASQLCTIANRIKASGGVEGCDLDKVRSVMDLADRHLPVINFPLLAGGALSDLPPAYTGPCRHLGQQTGEQPCKTCRGHVRQKVFACHHPRHSSSTITQCRACGDYTPGSGRHAVENWAVAMTTAPRKDSTLRSSIISLRKAGWAGLLRLFAEPEAPTGPARRGNGPVELITRQGAPLGAWGNFILGLTELHLREPSADAYLMLQDDVIFCQGLREYLEDRLWPGPNPGVVSLHTPGHLVPASGTGFFRADLGWSAWGAQAFVFSNRAARSFLADAQVVNHRLQGLFDGSRNVDSVVGDWCRRSGHEFYLHSPSLTQHTGLTSTLWPGTGLNGRRSASDFPGNGSVLSSALARHQKQKGPEVPHAVVLKADGTLAPLDQSPQKSLNAEALLPAPPATLHLRSHDSIAVIVIGRNDEQNLAECLDSVFAQTLQPDEVVYIDDAGEDGSMEVAARYVHRGLIANRLPQNLGMSAARMEGVKITTGALLLFVDSDNVLPPDYLATMVEDIGLRHDFVYPGKEFFGEEAVLNERLRFFPEGRWTPPSPDRASLWQTNYADTCSLMRRDAFLAVAGWRSNPADTMFDWDLALRLSRNGSHARSRAMLKYRVHGNNWSERERSQDRRSLNGLVRRHAASITVATIWSGRMEALQSKWISAIAASLSQAGKTAELLVFDDSPDGIVLDTTSLPSTFESVNIRRIHRGIATHSRRPDRRATAEFLSSVCNEALTRASGDIVWFIEDDIIVPEHGGDRLLKELLQTPTGPRPAVGGCYRTRHQPNSYWIAAHVHGNRVTHLDQLPPAPFPVHLTGTGCLMVLRDLLNGARFRTEWNNGLLRSTGHDWAFAWALHLQNKPVMLVPDVICRHHQDTETWV